jgi:hypothetical protein
MYLIREFHLEYIKNAFKLIMKRQLTQLKRVKDMDRCFSKENMQTANMHGKSAFPKKIYKWSA